MVHPRLQWPAPPVFLNVQFTMYHPVHCTVPRRRFFAFSRAVAACRSVVFPENFPAGGIDQRTRGHVFPAHFSLYCRLGPKFAAKTKCCQPPPCEVCLPDGVGLRLCLKSRRPPLLSRRVGCTQLPGGRGTGPRAWGCLLRAGGQGAGFPPHPHR